MKIALTAKRTDPASDFYQVRAHAIEDDDELPPELRPHLINIIELDDREAALLQKVRKGPADDELLNHILTRTASCAFYKGSSTGHNEAVMEG